MRLRERSPYKNPLRNHIGRNSSTRRLSPCYCGNVLGGSVKLQVDWQIGSCCEKSVDSADSSYVCFA
jgi:hypothetical protein